MRYLIPLAAPDTLFPREDFHFPKPQIEIAGHPMITRVIDRLKANDPDARFIFVVRAQDVREFSLGDTLRLSAGGACEVVALERPTQGAACSALMAIDHIDDDEPLVIANGDQVIDADLAAAFAHFAASDAAAGVVTFESVHPRWSYVRLDETGQVTEAAEKKVVSRTAIAGLYYFRRGADFVAAAQAMILNDRMVDGKFFIAPTLNEMILDGRKVVRFQIPAEAYHSLYSPALLDQYVRHLEAPAAATSSGGLQVVIPMAGQGIRFVQAGYDKPKPFIDVQGQPMIGRVIENLRLAGARFILIARRDHLDAEPRAAVALAAQDDVRFVPLDMTTEGAACTVMLARPVLDREAPLLIANCDQLVDMPMAAFVGDAQARGLDGSILCFRDSDPKWSFARLGADGLVTETREKVAISDLATVGLYYFRRAGAFLDAAADMIARNDRTNGEFYVCPAFNHAIAAGARIGVYEISRQAMHGLGTPEDLAAYLSERRP